MKLSVLTAIATVALAFGSDVVHSEPHALCADGGDPTTSPTVTPVPTTATPATTTVTPASTTVTPAPTPTPVNCKLFSEDTDPGAFDGNCVHDPVDKLWYEHKYLSVETPALNGGASCPSVQVKKQCPPVNCVVKDVCGVDPVTGHLLKPVSRTILTPPLYGGSACPPMPATPLPCDEEYYCGSVTDAADKAACENAFTKSGLVTVGFYSHPKNDGHKQLTFPHIWDCINACATDSTCIAYDYYFDSRSQQACYLVSRVEKQVSGYNGTATAMILRAPL